MKYEVPIPHVELRPEVSTSYKAVNVGQTANPKPNPAG